MESKDDFANLFDISKEVLQVAKFVAAGHNVFITGGARTGKTVLLQMIRAAYATIEHQIMPILCQTGSAAHVAQGQTLHSFIGQGLGHDDVKVLVANTLKNPMLVERWNQVERLAFDAVESTSTSLFKKAAAIARGARNKPDLPFGGIQVICAGDFLGGLGQCSKSNRDEHEEFLFQTNLWQKLNFKIVTLTHSHDHAGDRQWSELLERLRQSTLTENDMALLRSRIQATPASFRDSVLPLELVPTSKQASLNNSVFAEKQMASAASTSSSSSSSSLGGTSKMTCQSRYKVDMEMRSETKRTSKLPPVDISEFKAKQDLIGKQFPGQHRLDLAIRSQVLLLCRLPLSTGGFVDAGSLGRIVDWQKQSLDTDALPVVWFPKLSSSGSGAEAPSETKTIVPKATYRKWVDGFGWVLCQRLPLEYGFAAAIRTVQGRMIDMIRVNLADGMSSVQMAYTALSRTPSLECVWIQKLPREFISSPIVQEFYRNLESDETDIAWPNTDLGRQLADFYASLSSRVYSTLTVEQHQPARPEPVFDTPVKTRKRKYSNSTDGPRKRAKKDPKQITAAAVQRLHAKAKLAQDARRRGFEQLSALAVSSTVGDDGLPGGDSDGSSSSASLLD